MSVVEASKFVARSLSSRNVSKESEGLPIGLLFAGWNDGVPVLYRVNGEGKLSKGNAFAIGSGHASAFSILQFCFSDHMSLDEATEVARRATCIGALGAREYCGFASAFHIGADGKRKKVVDNEDINALLEMKYKPSLMKLNAAGERTSAF